MDSSNSLREHVRYLLEGGGAHVGFEAAAADLASPLQGTRVEGFDHNAYHVGQLVVLRKALGAWPAD